MKSLGDVINAIEEEAFKRVSQLERMVKQEAVEQKERMTKQEAVKQMDDMIAHAEDMLRTDGASHVWRKDIEALIIGKVATIKEIERTPIEEIGLKNLVFIEYEDGHGESKEIIEDVYCCPKCKKKLTKLLKIADRYVPSNRVRYCNTCGQKIDWSKLPASYQQIKS